MKTKRYLSQLSDELALSDAEKQALRHSFGSLLEATPSQHDNNLLMLTEIIFDWAINNPLDYASFITPIISFPNEKNIHTLEGIWFLEHFLEKFLGDSLFTLKKDGCFEIHVIHSPSERAITATALSLSILAHRHLPVPTEEICPMSRCKN